MACLEHREFHRDKSALGFPPTTAATAAITAATTATTSYSTLETTLPPSSIPAKRPSVAMDDAPRPRSSVKLTGHREPREKKETWRKKEAMATGNLGGGAGREAGGNCGGTQSGKQTGNTTPRGLETESPGLVRYQLPPPQSLDYHAHRAPPLVPTETPATEGQWFVVNDQYVSPAGLPKGG